MQTLNKRKFKQRFKELFFDEIGKISIEFDFNLYAKNSHHIYYSNKSGEILAIHNQNSGYFWLSNNRIWSKLQSEFTTLNYHEVKELTKDILEEHYKLKGITPVGKAFFAQW